jgi:hypothetical protein
MPDDFRKDIGDLYFLQRVVKTARWDANGDNIVNTDMLLEKYSRISLQSFPCGLKS